jgi:hypothetical protein
MVTNVFFKGPTDCRIYTKTCIFQKSVRFQVLFQKNVQFRTKIKKTFQKYMIFLQIMQGGMNRTLLFFSVTGQMIQEICENRL